MTSLDVVIYDLATKLCEITNTVPAKTRHALYVSTLESICRLAISDYALTQTKAANTELRLRLEKLGR